MLPSDEEIRIAITALANTKDALKNIQALEKSIGITINSADRMKMATSGAVSPKLANDAIKAKYALDDMDKSGKKVNTTFSSMINVVKGAITAMLTLAALRKVSEFFTGALESAQEFRAQMVQLNFSEVILSKKGMDVTRQELDDFVSYIEDRYQYLSKLDATKIVSETAGAVQEFDVSKDQLKALADSIAYIQLQNKLLGREEADAAHIINAAMDARSNFFNGMGINITETIVKEKAYKMGLVEVGEELTKQQRFQAILALLTEQTTGKQEELIKALEGTDLGNRLEVQKEYADASERIGTAILHITDSWYKFLASMDENPFDGIVASVEYLVIGIQSLIELASGLYSAYQPVKDLYLEMWGTTQKEVDARGQAQLEMTKLHSLFTQGNEDWNWDDFKIDAKLATGAKLTREEYERLLEVLKKIGPDKLKEYFPDPNKIGDRFVREAVINASQTKKSAGHGGGGDTKYYNENMGDGIDTESENAQKAVEKMHEEILDEYLKMQQDIEDATIAFNRKMDDISSEYQFKRLDAEQDYSNKVADINRDANRRIQDLASKQALTEAKAKQDALNKEREFQNKLLEMREDFLMDLDDALHARDARQILKLINQYNLDKTQAQRQHDLQKAEQAAEAKLRQQGYEAERKEAEMERKRKLEDAAIAFQQKLQQLAEEEARERIQAQLALQRKLQDIQLNLQQRLQLLGAGLVAEFNLTKAGLDAILSLYQSYYGPGGAIDQVYAGAMSRMSSTSLAPGANASDPQSQAGGYGHDHSKGFAEGGSLIVNKPTKVLVGERGPELAKFTPIGRTGKDVNKIFSTMGGSGGNDMSGKIELGLTLSPDLEARIISNTLNKTAQVVLQVNKSK